MNHPSGAIAPEDAKATEVDDAIPRIFQVHQQVPGLLRYPGLDRVPLEY